MVVSFRYVFGWMVSAFRCRGNLVLENLALRQQLLTLHAKRPRRRLTALHKLFWVALRTFWSGWTKPLVLVTPRTVVSWHRAGFRLYWTWVSRARQVGGRKRVSNEVRALIFRMVAENPTWGAPRIHGELLKLGFDLSERSVSRWVRRAPKDPFPAKRWLTFLRNHREAIAAMDFFTVPTLSSSLWGREQDSVLAETRRPASSLCGGSVDLRAVSNQTFSSCIAAEAQTFPLSSPHATSDSRRVSLQFQTGEVSLNRSNAFN